MCIFGTDCFDCGPRTGTAPPRPPPPPPARSVGCSNTCYAFDDGYCDDGGGGAEYSECAGGTDCTDCGPRDMSVVGFALQLAGDVSSFTPLVRTEMQSAIATVAGVHPSSVTVDVTSGSVIVDVRILTPTTTATLVQSAMVSATSTPNSRTSMFASVSGVSVTVLAVVTPPTVSASTPSPTVSASPPPSADRGDGLPCFPSSATVVLASGAKKSLDALQVGDEIIAATAEGILTTDTVSALSLADNDAESTFLVLSTAAGRNVTLTEAHHVPVGPSCCATLKTAIEIELGDTMWLSSTTGAARPSAVTKMVTVSKKGLHSPVMTNGHFPLVDGIVTAFDSINMVTVAGYGIPILEATGTIELFKRVAFDSQRKFL